MSSMMSIQTTEDGTDTSLPSFSTFTSELDPTWDYYDRDRSGSDVITSQSNNYTRPWEMETKEKGFEPFSKLPSFQSQFHSYAESNMMPEPSLPQVTPVPVPMSPNSAANASPGGNTSLTQLTPINPLQTGLTPLSSPSFHTLTAVNSRPYVPAPIQARDIPTIQQQYLDERHIQLYQPITTYAAPPPPPQNVVTVLKSEPANYELKNGLHHTSFQNPMIENGFDHNNGKIEKSDSPMRHNSNDARKKDRRKMRASSLESSTESESSAMETGEGNSGQVAAVSSTASFKSPAIGMGEEETNGEKQTKKKRKRCGECIGCQKKDNCGDCAPCRNDKSHQICKQRRCEKLTDKKIYGADGSLLRAESRRGRGKGRGGGASSRGRKVNSGAAVSPRAQPSTTSSISPAPAAVPHPSPNTAPTATTLVSSNGTPTSSAPPQVTTPQYPQQHQAVISPQVPPTTTGLEQHSHPSHPQQSAQQHHIQQAQQPQQQAAQPSQMKEAQQQPMTPMAFYPTWQADPSQGWQNQFIQQIPQNTPGISALNSIDFQPQGYAAYQPTGYVQSGLGFDPNYGRSYAAPVQRYDFQSNQIPPINQVSLQSVSFAPTASYAGQVTTGPSPMLLGGQNDLNKSRMSSSISGNEMPGYPRVSSVVPQHSLNCNGYSGEFSGAQQNAGQQQSQQNQNTSQQQQQQQQQQQHQQQSQSIQHGMHWKTDTNGVHWKAQTNGTRQPISDGLGSWKSQTNGVPSAQQQQQMPGLDANNKTGHFLSYSHHLRDLNTDGSLTSNSNTDMCLSSVQPNLNVEPTNGGGGVLPHWKSEAKPPDDFQSPQQQQGSDINSKNKSSPKLDSEKPVKKPAPKRQRKKPNASTQSQPPTKQTIDEKKSSSFMPNFNKGNDLYPPNAYGANTKYENSSPSYMPGVHTAPDPLNPYQPPDGFDAITAAKPPSANNFLYGSLGSKPLKQEPLSSIPPPRQPYPVPGSATNYPSAQVKMEGYERNYQNFINYADYCQSQNNSGSSTVSASGAHQTEYGQNYGNYPPYSSSAYHPHPHHQAYPNSPYNSTGVPNFSSIPSAETNCNNNQQSMSTTETQDIKPYMRDTDKETDTKNSDLTKLTNYEKDIPIHTYPNHGRFTDSTNSGHHTADGIKNHKIDDVSKSSNERFSFYEENGINANQEHQPMQQQQPQPQPFNGISYYPQKQGSTLNKDHLNNDKLSTDDMDLDKSYTSADLNQLPIDRTEKGMKPEVPDCDCFAPEEKSPPEPGSYYTHLGSASTLAELRTNMENRIGIRGRQLRIEKVIYSGKEGKTSQGCPLAKWIIRRVDSEEKILCIVKRRQGHKCNATFIVVCIVAWEGVPKHEADNSYRLLIHKLNKFGLPTTRRCATNENRTCACQGLDPETSGASFSFGCSWSMYYNGCKYARSKTVRKFRLSVKSEEPEIEEHMNVLATMLSPLYKTLAPKAYENQCKYESEAPDCRLGLKAGKPFSGVTTCMDFCAHAHRDLHNMQDGCTVQVGLLKPKSPGMPSDDEQLHILPLYVMDTTDEFDSGDAQKEKHKNGAVQVLEKFPCEVRVRATPLLPCRRHGKKRNGKDMPDDEETGTPTEETAPLTPAATPAPPTPTTVKKEGGKKGSKSQSKQQAQSPSHPLSRAETPSTANAISNLNIGSNSSNTSGSPSNHSAFSAPNQTTMMNSNSNLINMASMIDNFTDAQLQSNQISSTVLDSPYSYDYATGSYIDKRNYYNQQWIPPHAMETYGYPPADRNEQVKSRGSEENPDSTTIINANNSGSAFSPSVVDVTKMQRQQPQDYPTYGYHHHTTQPAYPMYPTYSTPSYNQTHHYNNLDYYNNDKLRYNFYTPHHPHHQPYNPYDIYHHASVGQIPQTQTPPPNWNLFSPAAPSAVPVATPHITTPPLSNSQSNNSTEPTLTNLSGLSEHMSPTAVSTPQPTIEKPTEDPIPQKPEPIGEITEINDNLDCFQDTQLGGIGIALEHGSVLIECAKHEMHATSSLKRPNRKNPTRITLIFYQHRNLNRHRHGIEEWEEKMRLKRLGITLPPVDEQKIEAPATKGSNKSGKSKPKPRKSRSKSDSKKEKIEKTPEIAAVIKEESNKFS